MSSQAFISNATATTLAAVGDGYSVPRMPTAQRLAIVFTARDQGMMVYDTTLNNLFIWNGSAWESVPASGDAGANGSVQYNDNGIIAGAANLQYDKAGGFTSLRSGSALRAYVADNSVYSTISDLGAAGGLTINNLNADGISLKIGGVNTNVLGAGTATWYDGAGAAQMVFDGSTKKLTIATTIDIWRGLLNDSTSTAVGETALEATIAGASGNTAVGYRSMYRATTADKNTALGVNTLAANGFSGSYNVAVGFDSMTNATSGIYNSAVGNGSLFNVTNGTGNSAVGRYAGIGISTGSYNTAIGYGTLREGAGGQHTGSDNVAIGTESMFSANSITGSNNIGAGKNTFLNLSSGAYNAAVGLQACEKVTTGSSNIGIGVNAARAITTGGNNVSIGGDSFGNSNFLCTGSYNIAIGNASMYSTASITGNDNVGIGRDTLRALSSGTGNTAVGYNASNKATTTAYTVAIGQEALLNNLTSDNVAVGVAAMYNNTTGSGTAVGRAAMLFSNTGTGNTAIGANAMRGTALFASSNNVAVGANALYNITSGAEHVAIGFNALRDNTTGQYSTAIGFQALLINNGDGNIAIGNSAGGANTTGQSNIFIGIGANGTGATASRQISIGSATYFVGTDGAANTYFATAGASLGYWRVVINGTARKIQVYADA